MTVKPMLVDMYLMDFIGTIHIMTGRYGPDITVKAIDTGGLNRISYRDLAPFMLQIGDILCVNFDLDNTYQILEIYFKTDINGWGEYYVKCRYVAGYAVGIRKVPLSFFTDNEILFEYES